MAKTAKSNGKVNNGEVIEVDAVEDNLDNTITQELVKHNVTDMVIAGLKDKYGGLQLKDLEDKEGYLEIKVARKEVRQWGILTENLCKKGREDAIAIQRKWLAKEKEVLGKIAEVQDSLDAEMNKYEKEIERKELEAANRREEAYMKRQQQLLKYGATYEDGSFVLNHISYEATLVKESDDDIWNETILPKYLREYEKNEAERVAIEKKREEETLALKAQQEEMNRQRLEFEEQQRVFREQQEQLRQQQEQADKVKREAEERERTFKAQQEEKLWRGRLSELTDIGWNGKYAFDKSDDSTALLTYEQLISLSDNEFNKVRDDYNGSVASRKEQQRIEGDRLAKELEEKREADRKEQIRVAEEQAAQREREKVLEEQRLLEQKRLQQEEENRIKMEQASDKMKWDHFLVSIKDIKYPDMKNATYKGKIEESKKLLVKIINL